MSDKHVLSKEGMQVTIEETEKGLSIIVTKIGKRSTSREHWIAAVRCPQGKVALGRLAQIKEYESQGFTYKGTSNGVMPTGVLTDDVETYFVSSLFDPASNAAVREYLRRPDSIPGVTFEGSSDFWTLLDNDRPGTALPMEGRLVIPDGAGTLAGSARSGSALQGVLLALAAKGMVDLAVTRASGETDQIEPKEVMRVAKTLVGKPRESLAALGILEPAIRDFTAAIGTSRRTSFVL